MTPNLPPVTITGIGSVSPYGPLAGLIPQHPSGTQCHHRLGNRRAAASVSRAALSPRQRGAGLEDQASRSPVGVGLGGFFVGH